MKIKITRPDGVVIEAEGTAEECVLLLASPAEPVPPTTYKIVLPYIPFEPPALPYIPFQYPTPGFYPATPGFYPATPYPYYFGDPPYNPPYNPTQWYGTLPGSDFTLCSG